MHPVNPDQQVSEPTSAAADAPIEGAPSPLASAVPEPHGTRLMGIVRWALVAASLVAATWAWAGYAQGQARAHDPSGRTEARPRYVCPMHPEIVSDDPGECPICHMSLELAAPERASASTPDVAPALDAGGSGVAAASPVTARGTDAGPSRERAQIPAGTAPVSLAFDRVQAIGVRTALAVTRDTGGVLRVPAVVTAAERGASEVHVRAAGFVERISVRETGVKVSAGQALLSLYSPEVFQAESELLAAHAFGDAGVRSVAASRQRLELLGMTTTEIDAVLASGVAARTIDVRAPAFGTVTKKSVVLGSYVTPETPLYEVVDLSSVWVVASVFSRDAAFVRAGAEGTFSRPDRPGDATPVKVDIVYPSEDPDSRTTRVRMPLPAGSQGPRPGQWGEVSLRLEPRQGVVVPLDAVVDSGREAYVFIDEGGGRFTPRVVVLGRELGDVVEIRSGVDAGERVVSGATFLVDSESRLRAALAPADGAKP